MFEKINNIEIKEVLEKLGISHRIHGDIIDMFIDGRISTSYIGSISKNIINDFSSQNRPHGSPFNFIKSHFKCDDKEVFNWFKANFHLEDTQLPQQKKRATFIKDMPDHNTLSILKRYLTFREIPYRDDNNLQLLAKELGSHEKLFISEGVHKDTLLFPMYNNGERTGVKMRTVDGTLFNGKKSGNVTGGNTGVIYSALNNDEIIICEGEPDYLALKCLGFNSVIGNLGGVSACRQEIKRLCKNAKRIVVCYDPDNAGIMGAKKLNFGRPHFIAHLPSMMDINDLIKTGWEKNDFEKVFDDAEEHNSEPQELYLDRFFFNTTKNQFYDVIDMSFVSKQQIVDNSIQVHSNIIKPTDIICPKYEGICYLYSGKKGYYNILDTDTIMSPSNNPEIHPDIDLLMYNICGNKANNREWLEKAIVYKFTHIDNVFVPAVIFHGQAGTGKGLFIKLLEGIFGPENTFIGLKQKDLESRFSAYTGGKLIVEFKEISVTNTQEGKKIMENLKTFIMEDKISIEKKGQDVVTIENTAWFFMSSNSSRPIQLDSRHTGNRRFSIIETGKPLGKENGQRIRTTIDERENIENFLAYLINKYGKIEFIDELINDEKRTLENLTEEEGDRFFEWFEKTYPYVNIISIDQRTLLLRMFYRELGEEIPYMDNRFIRQFNNNLSLRYKAPSDHKINFGEKKLRYYKIMKDGTELTKEDDKYLFSNYSF